MSRFSKILFIFISMQLLNASDLYSKVYSTILSGSVFNRDSKNIILLKATQNVNIKGIIIPIIDNKFRYELDFDSDEAYQLVFEEEIAEGLWHSVYFFPDSSSIEFALFDKRNILKNKIEGGQNNKEYSFFLSQAIDLFKVRAIGLGEEFRNLTTDGRFYSERYKNLKSQLKLISESNARKIIMDEIEELEKTGMDRREEGNRLRLKQEQFRDDQIRWKYKQIEERPTIVSYFLVWQDVKKGKDIPFVAERMDKAYKSLSVKFPKHTYSQVMKNEIMGFTQLRPGGKFIDFAAKDLGGKVHKISDQIKNKVAIVDLWASWCGPCIEKTKDILPLYKKYKNSQFTVVGIAREFKNTHALKELIDKENFSWLNLVELNDENGIWNLYGISNAAGKMLLIDKNGTIVATDPSLKEIETFLSKNL